MTLVTDKQKLFASSSAMSAPGDIAAEWKIHAPDGVYEIVFEHGTATGRRVIRVNGKEVGGE